MGCIGLGALLQLVQEAGLRMMSRRLPAVTSTRMLKYRRCTGAACMALTRHQCSVSAI